MTKTETVEETAADFYQRTGRQVKMFTRSWPEPPVPYETADGEVLVIAAEAAAKLRLAAELIAEIKQSPVDRNPGARAGLAIISLEIAEKRSPHCRGEARRLAGEMERLVVNRWGEWKEVSAGAPPEEPEPTTEAVLEAV